MSHRSVLGWALAICLLPTCLCAQEAALKETSGSQQKVAKGTTKSKTIVPVFTLYQPIQEAPQGDNPFGSSTGEPLKDLVARLEKARDDKNVVAVAVLLGDTSIGNGQLEEIYQALNDIKENGKPVYAFADHLSFRNLALVSSASRISVAPVGELMITGMYGSQLHLRGLLNRLHVTPDFLTCGDYKSAGETFMREEPSPEAKRMYNWLFDSIFDNYLELIAKGRDQSQETVRQWVDHGLYSAKEATELGIVDAAEFRQEFVDHIKRQHGDNVELKTKYAKKNKSSIDLSSPFGALKLWADLIQGSTSKRSGKDTVAIVYVEGAIVPGRPKPSPFGSQGVAYSDPIRKALDKAAEDDSVKAVVLRVNSPGGSAVASEIILQATRRVAAEKPFVVSMGDVAGSGGYYVACGTDTIFADASTITASIGVVSGKLVTQEMWESVGINFHPIQRGKNAGMLSSAEMFSEEQKEIMQGWMDEVYEIFKGHVVKSRGDRLTKPIDEIAGGRVYTGQQALELGLIDRLGSLRDAVRFVADQAKLDAGEYEIRVIPKPKNLMELMLSDLVGTDEDSEIQLRSLAMSPTQPLWKALGTFVGRMQPQRYAALQRALVQLEILQHEGVTLATPEFAFE
jgi:protease-4